MLLFESKISSSLESGKNLTPIQSQTLLLFDVEDVHLIYSESIVLAIQGNRSVHSEWRKEGSENISIIGCSGMQGTRSHTEFKTYAYSKAVGGSVIPPAHIMLQLASGVGCPHSSPKPLLKWLWDSGVEESGVDVPRRTAVQIADVLAEPLWDFCGKVPGGASI